MTARTLLAILLLGAATPAAAAKIVFLIGEREYDTRTTLPAFAEAYLKGHECVFLNADPDNRDLVPGMSAVADADLLVVSLRRRALPKADLQRVRDHVAAGKPLVSLRTGNHAFSLKGAEPPPGHATWEGFDVEVLGGRYDNHLKAGGTLVAPTAPAGVPPFKTGGTLYRIFDLSEDATVWAVGVPEGETEPRFPVLWSRTTEQGGRVVSSTLGHPSAFEQRGFVTLLKRGFDWVLEGRS